MLYQLEIENFYSVRDAQTLDLRVSEAAAKSEPHRFGALCNGCETQAPKVVSLFGANASGKSNVLRALAFVTWFIQHSFLLPPDSAQPCEHFYDENGAKKPTRIAVQFGAPSDLTGVETEAFARFGYEVSFRN